MKTFLRQPCFRFLYATGTAMLLAACALFVFVALSVLVVRQPSPALAQGSGTRAITHTVTSDFNVCTILPGTTDRVFTDTVASSAYGGEIRLAAFLEDYFDGTEVDTATWVISERYSGPPVVGGGLVTIVNAGLQSVITVPVSGRVFEARARLQQPGGETGWGDIGFGRRDFPGSYSADEAHRLFITDDSNRVYANAVDDGGTRIDTLIEGVDLTQFHVYGIEWGLTETLYYLDGTYFPTATIYSTFVYEPYIWLFTDQYVDTIDVDWVRVLYYPTTTGQYESCVVDGGSGLSNWTTISWTVDLPPGASVAFETRASSDGSTWSSWAQVSGSGDTIPSPTSRYLQYRVTLTTTDVYASPEIGSVAIGYDSDAPFADAGGPYTTSEGVSLELDGSGSTDPDNNIVYYEWDLDYDGSFDIDATGITTTVTFPDGPETRTIALRVTDEDGYTDEQSTTVTVNNVAPTADAGGPYTVDEGDSVGLSGSGSDVPSDTLSYAWDLDDDGFFDDATGQTPTFDASSLDGPDTVTVTLQVSDDDGGVTTDTATISVDNVAPTVTNVTNAGPVYEGSPVTVTVAVTDSSPLDTFQYRFDCDNNGFFEIGWQTSTSAQCMFYDDTGSPFTVGAQARDDDLGLSNVGTTAVTVNNVVPTADAGGPYTVDEGDSVGLSGSATDPGTGDTLTYEWDLDDDGYFDDATGQTPTFDASSLDGPTTVTVTLQVSDGDGGVDTDIAIVTVNNVAPIADANGPYSVNEGSIVPLTGSGTDVPSDTLTYAWDLNDDSIFETAGANPNFDASSLDGPTTVTVTLRVSDDDGGVTTDTTTISVNNVAPTADAGGPYTVDEGDSVGLSGSGTDVPADTLSYAWDLDDDGYFDDATGQTPTFNASGLDGPTTVTVTLQVSDGDGGVTTDSTTVTVENVAPTADAGGPYTVDEGGSVGLSGSGTDPVDTLSYAWDLDDDGYFDDATGQTPTFNASGLDGPTTVTVTLQVSDGDDAATDTAVITVNNVAPTADAGGPYTVDEGDSVGLSGSGTDPVDTLSYAWDLDDDGYFDDATGQTPTFDASSLDGPDTVTVTLQVSDGDGGVATDTAVVTVDNMTPTVDAGGPYMASTGEIITFTVTITDALADSHTVEWDLDDNGTFETIGQAVTRTYTSEGDYQVGVRVTDDDGAWATDVAQVVISVYKIYLPAVFHNVSSGDGTSASMPASTDGRWSAELCPAPSGPEPAGTEEHCQMQQSQASETWMGLALPAQDLDRIGAFALQQGWIKSMAEQGKSIDVEGGTAWSKKEQEGVV